LIGPRDTKAKVRQNFSDARHPNAADADKMNVLEWSEHFDIKSQI
jgi:hypothetical protein